MFETGFGWPAEAARTRNEAQVRRPFSESAQAAAHEALRVARTSGRAELKCDALGRLALGHASSGDPDSVTFYMNEAIEVAVRQRFPVRAASLSFAYSHCYYRQGREGLAAELRDAAVDYCRDLGGGADEVAFLSGAMSIHASYGNWELVDRDRVRAMTLCVEDLPPEFRLYEARTLLSRGQLTAASEVFRTEHDKNPKDLVTLEYWTLGLLESGRPEEALEVVDRALELTRNGYHGLFTNRFRAMAASAHLDLGDTAAARQALREMVGGRAQRGDPWMRFRHAILEARALFQEADSIGAAAELQKAESELRAVESVETTGSGRHLVREEARKLRRARRELAGKSPARGYAVSFDDPGAAVRVRDWIRAVDGCHLFFDEDDGAVLRWTVTGEGVRCDTLGHTSRIYAAVRLAGEAVAGRRGVAEELHELLGELGRQLLPPEVRSFRSHRADGPRDLLITARGALRLLPFEVLGTADDEYRPLLLDHDVAYLRATRDPLGAVDSTHTAHTADGANGADDAPDAMGAAARSHGRLSRAGLVLADPLIPADLARRYPGLGRLEGGMAELEHLRTLRPGCRSMVGGQALRSRLIEAWEDEPFLYFACHIVRDPENPFWTFLPLASPGAGAGPEVSRLEVIDILEADLRKCSLVVLSGCGSGMPHVTPSNVAPSLADAFLDAGASAVVQTFWKVRDDETAILMKRFQDLWLQQGKDPISALSQARRERWDADDPHPFTWAAFGIQLRTPPKDS